MVDGNTVINVKHYGNYMATVEQDNFFVDACFDADEVPTVTFKVSVIIVIRGGTRTLFGIDQD